MRWLVRQWSSEIHQVWRKRKRMLIVESGHGIKRGRESKEEYSFAARLNGLQAEDSTRQLQGNRGELSFSFIVGAWRGIPSRMTPSHMMAVSQAQRLGALQDQITGWASEIYKAGCGKFEGSLREIGGSWPNAPTGILALGVSHTRIHRVPASLIGEQRTFTCDQRAERLGKKRSKGPAQEPRHAPRILRPVYQPAMAIAHCCPWHTS